MNVNMRIPVKSVVAVLIIIFAVLTVFFSRQNSSGTKDVTVTSTISGHKAEFRNKEFLMQKLNAIHFWESTGVDHLTYTLSPNAQSLPLSKRLTEVSGEVVDATSYTAVKNEREMNITISVNPQFVPLTDTATMSFQYSQLLLIAAYNAIQPEGVNQQDMLTFLQGLRNEKNTNLILSVL